MKRCFSCLAVLAAMMMFSCKDRTGEWLDRIPILKVSSSCDIGEDGNVSLSGKAQTVDFTVLSSSAWSVELSGTEEMSLSTSVGSAGKTVITLLVLANESGAERTAQLSFYLEGKLNKILYLTQELQYPYIEVNVESKSVSPYGETFTIGVDTNQSEWSYEVEPASDWLKEVELTSNSISFTCPANETGNDRKAEVVFLVEGRPELWALVEISQKKQAAPPTDLLLDVVFYESGAALDLSPMNMTVMNDRRDADTQVKYVEKYGRYAASFTNGQIARSSLDAGYYYVPYTTSSEFANKLADGYSYELVFCTYYDPLTYTDGLKQVKPFSSTQAGGIGVCLQANTGFIQFETHVGGSWISPKSSIIPVPQRYYHVVCTWSKTDNVATIYVDGKFEAAVNTTGDLKFPDTNVDKRWFGIGADLNHLDKGEASFYGEVVIARLYDAPMSAEEAAALYYALNK